MERFNSGPTIGGVVEEEFQEEEMWGVSISTQKNNVSRKNVSSIRKGTVIPVGRSYGTVRYGSAPVNVPDWCKILKEEKQRKSVWDDDVYDVSDGDDDSMGMVPPHEYLARRRSGEVSFSVCEGVGRTLKGRDLRKLRNAILAKTGFLE